MIDNFLLMGGYGIYVWASFLIVAFFCFLLFYSTRKTLKKYERDFAKELEKAKGSRKALAATYREAIEAHQRITQGRNPVDMSPEEYLKELFETNDVIDGLKTGHLRT